MNKKTIMRILDANINRSCEGIRVIEDIARFNFEDENLTNKLRNIRHNLRMDFSIFDNQFLSARDSEHDIGKVISSQSSLDKKSDIKQIINANLKRVAESLRVIEELTKIIDYPLSKKIETFRYETYQLEKTVINKSKKIIPKGLYGITAERFANGKSNIECVREMIKGGIKIIQYREKDKNLRVKIEEAKEISLLCKENDVTFIINDHIEISILVDADGVHLGQNDMRVKDARIILGEYKIIGVSTHSPEQAKNAEADGADYIGVGPIFRTNTKNTPPVGYEYLKYAVENVKIPFITIGGIKEEHLEGIINHGAERVALVSDIVGADDIVSKIKRLEEKFKIKEIK